VDVESVTPDRTSFETRDVEPPTWSSSKSPISGIVVDLVHGTRMETMD
jgi:hypothetical protein